MIGVRIATDMVFNIIITSSSYDTKTEYDNVFEDSMV